MIPFGDEAIRFDVPHGKDRRVLLATLRACPSVIDVVIAEEVGAVTFAGDAPLDALRHALALGNSVTQSIPTREHAIRVAYDGADLEAIADATGLSRSSVIAAHADREYVVAMLGFMPGFAYLRGLDPRLVVARRSSPRTRVPPRSLAIGAEYTGLYPFASPGGWHLLGSALDFAPFDEEGAVFGIGDRVRFVPSEGVPMIMSEKPLPATSAEHLEVVKTAGLAIAVDAGRPGRMHEGVPSGGPLVPEGLARANAAVGNAAGTCAIEIVGMLELVARGRRFALADDANGAVILEENATHRVTTGGAARVRYLAVAGGFEVPLALGARSTLLVARLGGFGGRGLRRGDRVSAMSTSLVHHPLPASSDDDGSIPIRLGPDRVPDETIARMLGATFRIAAASDRIGTRLEGPPLHTHSARDAAMPMVRGAIELTPSGLIVLGPDHPTTGGYPVVGVVRPGAIGRLFARPIGAAVRLEAC